MPGARRRDLNQDQHGAAEQAEASGKPANVVDRIVEGKLNKWYEEHVLLDQPFVKNDDQTVAELIASVVGVLGEKIAVRRFAKFALGDAPGETPAE